MSLQKDAFLRYEADNWFHRNQGLQYEPESDAIISIMKEYKLKPDQVLEIGCSKGYRLHAITQIFDNVSVTGLEPSEKAIRQGSNDYPRVKFLRGTADDMTQLETGGFDVIIVGFVFYVVDRNILLKVVSEIDRLLRDGGILFIIDFFAEKPNRNPYLHIQEINAFAYKQNYEEIFTSSHLYQLMDKRCMGHSKKNYDLSGDYYDKYTVSTLRKDLSAAYK